MQYLYIIFSSTDTGMGKNIRRITKNKYNHLSAAIGETPEKLYSFSRYYYTAPFYGGFVNESLNRYKNACFKICRVPLDDAQYKLLSDELDNIKNNSKEYIYNVGSALVYPYRKRIYKQKSYTCIEFGIYLLSLIGFIDDGFYTFQSLEKLLSNNVVYEGRAVVPDKTVWGDDTYAEDIGRLEALKLTAKNHFALIKR